MQMFNRFINNYATATKLSKCQSRRIKNDYISFLFIMIS